MHQKRRAKKNPYVLECERIKKQKIRQGKIKNDDYSEINVPRKRRKHDEDTLSKMHQKDFETIEKAIKQFQSDISVGPLYVCTCCHQTWFRKSVSMLKNTNLPAERKRLYCTDFTSISNEGCLVSWRGRGPNTRSNTIYCFNNYTSSATYCE